MIEAIEQSAYAVWVRESPSFWAYTWILSLHAMGLAIIVGINSIVALRLLGYVPEIKISSLRKLFPWMYLGFTSTRSRDCRCSPRTRATICTTGCSS